MAPNKDKDQKNKDEIGEIGERGLILVSNRTSLLESFPRRERRPSYRLGPLKPLYREPRQ